MIMQDLSGELLHQDHNTYYMQYTDLLLVWDIGHKGLWFSSSTSWLWTCCVANVALGYVTNNLHIGCYN